jgi:CubicO group peptidase (beta-lactamase class C family)
MASSSVDALTERLNAALQAAIDDQRVVGATICIAHRGETVFQQAVGLANREAGQPMRLDTLVRLASITKPFVTAATLALIERGTFKLDDAIDKYLPDFRPRLPSGDGHAWFVDPVSEYSTVLLTNTALEGMIGRLPLELVDALYG